MLHISIRREKLKMFGFYFLFITISSLTICSAQNYCNIQSCKRKPHTLCQYTSSKPSDRCSNYISQGLTSNERDNLLKLHNMLRQKVAHGHERRGKNGPQPPAKNMPNLMWDNQLEKIAQRWANQCKFAHDQCRDIEKYHVGQNIAKMWKSPMKYIIEITIDEMVKAWYDEVALFDRQYITKYQFVNTTGHYTQMIWAETTKIGCGIIKYQERNLIGNVFLVCNYSPAGNIINQAIYEPRY